MKNIFIELEYVGARYFGFQVQNKKDTQEITVQDVLELALEDLLKQKIRIIYASRTDRGVHACGQTANFIVDTKIPLQNIKRALNSRLPGDIQIKKIQHVPLSFHARFSVVSKVYRYVIFNKKKSSVFWHERAWHVPIPLDIETMRNVACHFVGQKDFSLFAKDAKRYKSCVRCIKNIVVKENNNFVYIDIEGDGFLRSMVRNIVALLVSVGEGKLKVVDAVAILDRTKMYVNKPAPAGGLYLKKVYY